jgi:carboxymethylenebutenolidase
MDAQDKAKLERKQASDFPQELLDLLDSYVHGRIGRRDFVAGAGKFATATLSAAALVEMLRPNYAWAIQVPEDDKRLKTEKITVQSPAGTGHIDCYLARPASARGKLPGIIVIHENRGLKRMWHGGWRWRAIWRWRLTD